MTRIKNINRVAIVYPSGNTTAVIFDRLPHIDRKQLNTQIINTWQQQYPSLPQVEQCCFITPPRSPKALARVEMFGGEFCGNATRSAIWLITKGCNSKGKVEVSGVKKPLAFSVTNNNVSVEMPLPEDKTLVQEVVEGLLVQLDGISQLVVTEKCKQAPRQLLTDLLKRNAYDLFSQPAVGVSYYDRVLGKAEFCVWVKEVDTMFDETACGSGTSAIGVALATRARWSVDLNVIQPSGEAIRTEASYQGGKVAKSFITGKVDILYDGECTLTWKN